MSVLKGSIDKMEQQKSQQDNMKAELEYNLRAAEYNVEILKNQIENMNSEIVLTKKENE